MILFENSNSLHYSNFFFCIISLACTVSNPAREGGHLFFCSGIMLECHWYFIVEHDTNFEAEVCFR